MKIICDGDIIMNEGSKLIEFREIADELTPTEVRIVEYIEKNFDATVEMSITELACNCKASESGIVRLCKKMGFKGYQELKIALAKKQAGSNKAKHLMQDVELNDSTETICRKIFGATVQALKDTQDILKASEMERAVELVNAAHSINFYGLGGSGVVANDAYFRFSKLGLLCNVFIDSHSQLTRSLLTGPKDLIVAISHSGCSKDLLIALTKAKANKTPILAVTQFGNSPITKLADVTLFTSSQETIFRHDAMASRIAETVLLDSLFTCAAVTRYEEVIKYYDSSWEALKHMRVESLKDL